MKRLSIALALVLAVTFTASFAVGYYGWAPYTWGGGYCGSSQTGYYGGWGYYPSSSYSSTYWPAGYYGSSYSGSYWPMRGYGYRGMLWY